MAAESAADSHVGSQKPKRSLFNKPTWAKPQATEPNEDLFSRSKQLLSDIAKEEQERLRKRSERRSSQEARPDDHALSRGKKRRRGEEDGPKLEPSGTVELVIASQELSQHTSTDASEEDEIHHSFLAQETFESSEPLSKQVSGSATQVAQQDIKRTIAAIELSDDEDVVPVKLPRNTESSPDTIYPGDSISHADDDDGFSEEEFPELVQKARERARLRQEELASQSSSRNGTSPHPARASANAKGTHHASHAPGTAEYDPNIEIFIDSPIPNTQPLIVTRKVSQSLGDVRYAWCLRQGFTAEQTFAVHFTWRGKRLFDVTTCKSLGIGLDKDGVLTVQGEKDLLGELEGRIHMEAVTEEIVQARKMAKQHGYSYGQEARSANNAAAVQPPPPPPPPAANAEPQIRLILKAKGYDDFRLLVKPSTKISKMTNAFRQAKGVDPVRDVFLMFDGEKLDPASIVAATDISDLDYIDAYVK